MPCGKSGKNISRCLRQRCTTSAQKDKIKKAPWITNDIKNLMYARDRFKRKAILTSNENDWLNFRATRNKVNIKLKNAKKNYYSSKIAGQKSNLKKAWKSINSLSGRQNKPPVVNELTVVIIN